MTFFLEPDMHLDPHKDWCGSRIWIRITTYRYEDPRHCCSPSTSYSCVSITCILVFRALLRYREDHVLHLRAQLQDSWRYVVILVLFSVIITINAPINLTVPCIIFSGGFFSLRGRLGPWIETFLGSKWHERSKWHLETNRLSTEKYPAWKNNAQGS